MTSTTQFVLRPEVRFEWSQPDAETLRGLASELTTLQDARPGQLVGFALGHGSEPLYPEGPATEYFCAFVGNGDGRSCDGRVFRMEPEAHRILDGVMSNVVHDCDLAWKIREELMFSGDTVETIHFRGFTVAMSLNGGDGQIGDVSCLQILMDRPRSADEARQRIAAIEALFHFLGEWHTLLKTYRIDLSGVQALLTEA